METKAATALCLEQCCSGGSSGEIKHSKNLMKMLHTPNSTPCCSTGSIFLEGVFYINRKDLKAVGTGTVILFLVGVSQCLQLH